MFLLRTESEDISVACVWCDSVVPQFNDTRGSVLCLEVKAARRAPPHGLRPYNHGGAFFRGERDRVWVTYERPNEHLAETTRSKKRKERDCKQALWLGSGTDSSHVFWRNYTLVPDFSGTRENILSCQKRRRGLRHFQAGLHQGHGVCTFLFEKNTFHKWHIQQKLCPDWKKLSHEEFYHILVKARRFFFGSPAASLLHNLFWFALQVCSTNTFTVLFFFWQKKKKKIAVVLL